jgi:CCR4-NOT transcription complex subunit 3
LESLEQKLNNAPTQSMKEKYEIEMKKEIKKLQRVREFFRALINNPDIKDKSKPLEARRRVEIVKFSEKNTRLFRFRPNRICY